MMEAVRRRLKLTRRDGGAARTPKTASGPTVATPFVDRLSDTMQTGALPFKRLFERVKGRLAPTKTPRDVAYSMASTARTTTRTTTLQYRDTDPTAAALKARLESLKFCIWRGGACGWVVQRRYLYDEAQFVWVVSHVTSVAAWEDDGIRPGDVLETINGESLACVTREEEVRARLRAAPVGTTLRFRVRGAFDRCRVQRFFVVVDGQPIGASIAADGVDAVPVVIHVPSQENCGVQTKARRGDVLIEVNGESVIGWGMHAVIALVEQSRPHLTFTFQRWMHTDCGPRCRDGARMVPTTRRPSAKLLLSRGSSVVGSWHLRRSGDEFHDFGDDDCEDEDALADENKVAVIVWKSGPLGLSLVKDEDAHMPAVSRLTGKGAVRGIEKLRPGFHLASVNGHPTHRRSFREVLSDLQHFRKPVWLVFLPPQMRVSMYSASSRDTSAKRSSYHRGSSSSSLLSVNESWGLRSTARFTTTVATTYESEDE